MEVKINHEIRNYTESVFFGLSLRQLIFSVLAVGVAIGLYFFLKPYVGTETVSWMCILGAAPFAAMGFVSYHGMTAEQFLWAWFRSEILEPKEIIFEPVNLMSAPVFAKKSVPLRRWKGWNWTSMWSSSFPISATGRANTTGVSLRRSWTG